MTDLDRLKRLKSDLADCYKPVVLAKWPELASPLHIAELKKKIAELEARLSGTEND